MKGTLTLLQTRTSSGILFPTRWSIHFGPCVKK